MWVVGGDGTRSGQSGVDVVGGIGELRKAHRVAWLAAQNRRKPGDQFLGPDQGEHRVWADLHAVSAGERASRRRAKVGRAPGPWVGGRGCGRGDGGAVVVG